MTGRKVLLALIILMAALVVSSPVWAGGWAVTTLDHLPEQIVADEAVTVGFVVRQHGREPVGGLAPVVGATHRASGENLTVSAVEDRPAHYSASLTFPTEGEWDWWIDGFGIEQPMPALTVLSAANTPPQEGAASALPLIGTLIGAAGLVAGALVWTRRQRWGIALVLASLAVIAAALIPAFSSAPAAAASAQPPDDPAARGAALFVAKGCIVCHTNSRAGANSLVSLNVGPDLSRYGNTPEYLRVWLSDPAVLKPGTRMPDLDLSDEEIEALITFLNAGQ